MGQVGNEEGSRLARQGSFVGEPRLLAFEIAVEFTLAGVTLSLKSGYPPRADGQDRGCEG